MDVKDYLDPKDQDLLMSYFSLENCDISTLQQEIDKTISVLKDKCRYYNEQYDKDVFILPSDITKDFDDIKNLIRIKSELKVIFLENKVKVKKVLEEFTHFCNTFKV